MFHFFKSSSRTVHHYPEEEKKIINYNSDDTDQSCISLTVWRKSLIFSCNGFTVIGCDGSLVYRVDNYTGNPHQIILMDGLGNPLFTICRPQKLRLVDSWWLVYDGDSDQVGKSRNKSWSGKLPLFRVKKNVNVLKRKQNNNVLAYVYCDDGILCDKNKTRYKYNGGYVIHGSYAQRSCKILDESKRVVAEIKRKQAMTGVGGVSFGLEVFVLIVKPGFDPGFAMAIVLILDQMFS